jgi:hypothetical protein
MQILFHDGISAKARKAISGSDARQPAGHKDLMPCETDAENATRAASVARRGSDGEQSLV